MSLSAHAMTTPVPPRMFHTIVAAVLLWMLALMYGASSFSCRPQPLPSRHNGGRRRRRRIGEGLPSPSSASSCRGRHQRRPMTTPAAASSSSSSSSSLSNDEIVRYSRHLVLGDVGVVGQERLKNASVLVIGAGGLGSPCLLYLAAAGVGHIGIVDGDTVDHSNLQRQIIHGTSTVGVSKCESAQRRINDVNPFVKVRLYEQEFTSTTAMDILGNGFEPGRPYDVVVDGSDNFPTKYLINDACDLVGVPWVYSAILAFEGQLSVFNYQGGPTYRDLLPVPPPPGDVPSCAEGGVLGVLPGTMGCLQATETIKLLLQRRPDEITSGRVLVFDAMKMKFGQVGLSKLANRHVVTELIDYQGFCAGPKTIPQTTSISSGSGKNHVKDTDASAGSGTGRTMDEVENDESEEDGHSFHAIEPVECLKRLSDGWAPWVLDVRLQTENDIVALPFTDTVVPHRTVRIENIPESGDVLVYCKAGVRGKKACHQLIGLGVEPERLYNLEGGIMRWQRDVDPAMPRY